MASSVQVSPEDDWRGVWGGIFEDLSAVQTILVEHLKNVRSEIFKGLAFKVYLEYECFLSRGPYTPKAVR